MATKSFLKDIVIKNRSSANSFLSALENAEKKGRKKVKYDVAVQYVEDAETIKKIFKKR